MRRALLAFVVVLGTAAFTDPPGPQNPGPARYNYGPSVLWDADALRWRAWWCGPRVDAAGNNVGGDAIWYSDSADAASWTPAQVVFQPATSGWDSYHVCDPSVLRNVKLAGTVRPYVMYYTGADGLSGGGDMDGRIGVAWSSNGITWTRVQQLTLQCQSTTSYGCQHFSAIKVRENDPDPAFGGRYVAIYSQTKTDASTGTYVVESPDGINWWGNAGAPGSLPQRVEFPASVGYVYNNAGMDLLYDRPANRYLLTFTAFSTEYVYVLPARWYGGIEASFGVVAAQLEQHTVSAEGSYAPGFLRQSDGYRPWSPGADSWRLWSMTANRNIRDASGMPQETQLVRIKWAQ